LKPLLALAVVLATVLGWESLSASPEDPVAAPAVVAPIASSAPQVAPPVSTWVDLVQARPLFARDRRPRAQASAASAAVPGDTLPRLTGTVRSNDRLLAIFAPVGPATPPADGASATALRPVVVGRDGMVAGWTVVAIADGVVTLERDGRTMTLILSFANGPLAPPIEAPPAVVVLHEKRTNPFLQP
jgi:hypothetical protein